MFLIINALSANYYHFVSYGVSYDYMCIVDLTSTNLMKYIFKKIVVKNIYLKLCFNCNDIGLFLKSLSENV